ncbi:hypothetical protein Ato02nite_018470 [Paractinoplanes toevensis]|uniref:Uncharacterized protein n=1 Tax=Paractinoplanes toevensis TaxID=571911 RepID=A0A919T633_9ACTN|nr:hypothetical protein Ato02nite_018470 [Actinoplanes toevensis]
MRLRRGPALDELVTLAGPGGHGGVKAMVDGHGGDLPVVGLSPLIGDISTLGATPLISISHATPTISTIGNR